MFALREIAWLVSQMFVDLLEVERQGIIDHGLDFPGFQKPSQFISVEARICQADGVIVARRVVMFFNIWRLDTIHMLQHLIVE